MSVDAVLVNEPGDILDRDGHGISLRRSLDVETFSGRVVTSIELLSASALSQETLEKNLLIAHLRLVLGLLFSLIGDKIWSDAELICFARGVEPFVVIVSQSSHPSSSESLELVFTLAS